MKPFICVFLCDICVCPYSFTYTLSARSVVTVLSCVSAMHQCRCRAGCGNSLHWWEQAMQCCARTHAQRMERRGEAMLRVSGSCANTGLWPVMTVTDPDTNMCSIQMNISLSMSAIHLCQSLSAGLPVYLCSLPVTYLSLSLSLCLSHPSPPSPHSVTRSLSQAARSLLLAVFLKSSISLPNSSSKSRFFALTQF